MIGPCSALDILSPTTRFRRLKDLLAWSIQHLHVLIHSHPSSWHYYRTLFRFTRLFLRLVAAESIALNFCEAALAFDDFVMPPKTSVL